MNLARRSTRRLIHVLEEHFTGMPSAAVDQLELLIPYMHIPCKSEVMENEIDYKALLDRFCHVAVSVLYYVEYT